MEVRASVVSDVIRAIDVAFPAWSSLVDAGVRRRVGVVPPAEWVPAAWLFDIEEAVLRLSGADAVRALRRKALALTLGSFYGPAKDAAVSRAQPGDPLPLLRLAPGSRAQGMRGLGDATFEETAEGARLRVVGAPPAVAASAAWRAGTAGSLLGLLDAVGAVGEVRVHDDGTDVVFDVSWGENAQRRG